MTKIKPCPTWIFWSTPHSRIMATHHPPHLLSPSCRRFWCEIHRQIRRRTPYFRTEKTLWNIWRLDRGVILRHHTKEELWKINTETICRYLNARLHHKKIEKYQHEISKRPQHAPYRAAAQEPIKKYDSKTAGTEGINRVQKIVVSILYYSISVDTTILMALSTLASEQSKVTAQKINNLHQILD